MITVDGIQYDVKLISPVSINGAFKYKIQGDTQDGSSYAEAQGFYPEMTLIIEGKQNVDFIKLYKYLATMRDGNFDVNIELMLPTGTITHKMRPGSLDVELPYLDENENPYWGDMSVDFKAVKAVTV